MSSASTEFDWMIGLPAAYQPTPEPDGDDGEALDPVPGLIEEVRDELPDRDADDHHVRVVLNTETGLVDVDHSRVEVLQ